MENNDILKRIRYTFDLGDAKMIEIFKHVGFTTTRDQVSNWLKKDDDESYKEITDYDLASFLNGFIIEKRGKRDGPQPQAEQDLSNNNILRKVKIALDLKTDDILSLYRLIDKKISPHELSAFLRNPKQNQYRPCNDQYLRHFLSGVQKKFRVD